MAAGTNQTAKQLYEFGPFRVDPEKELLLREGEIVPLTPKTFQILLVLIRNRKEVVTKDELLRAVWPDTFVEEANLSRNIFLLRKALGESPQDHQYVVTVPGRGYRFAEEVQFVPEQQLNIVAASHARVQVEVKESSRWPWLAIVAGVLATAVVAIAAVAAYRWHWQQSPHEQADLTALPYPSFVKAPRPIVTVPGFVWFPALSPDGRQIAFDWSSKAQPRDDLYVQLIGGDQPLQLTHNKSGNICCAAWSPDGQQIAYGHCDDHGGAVFVVPALGGVERKIADVVCLFGKGGWPQWTADGQSLVLADQCSPTGPRGVVLFSLRTGERRCLASPPPGGDEGDTWPTLSPDQKTVAFFRSINGEQEEVYTVDIAGKKLRQLTHNGNELWGPITWTMDGKFVMFNSGMPDIRGPVRVSVDGGVLEAASTFPATGSLSRDGRRLAYVQGTKSASIWRVDLAASGGKVLSVKSISLSSLTEDSPQLAPDGHDLVVRSSRAAGRGQPWKTDIDGQILAELQLWKTDINGQNPVELTGTTDAVGSPHWSPDGKWIAMDVRPADHTQIWMVDSEGRNFHAVIADQYENFVPRWTRDGRSIYFTSNRSGEWQIWKLDLASGQKTRITDQGGISPLESYDGSMLYYAKRETGGIFRRPLSGGPEVRVTDGLHVRYWGAFAVTENGIYYLNTEATPRPAIFYFDLRTKRSIPVLPLERMPAPDDPTLTATRDGRILLFAEWDAVTHINLAEASP